MQLTAADLKLEKALRGLEMQISILNVQIIKTLEVIQRSK